MAGRSKSHKRQTVTAENDEAVLASGVEASDDPNSIVAVRARLMDGLPEIGDVLRPVLEGTPATRAFARDASWKQIYGSP